MPLGSTSSILVESHFAASLALKPSEREIISLPSSLSQTIPPFSATIKPEIPNDCLIGVIFGNVLPEASEIVIISESTFLAR